MCLLSTDSSYLGNIGKKKNDAKMWKNNTSSPSLPKWFWVILLGSKPSVFAAKISSRLVKIWRTNRWTGIPYWSKPSPVAIFGGDGKLPSDIGITINHSKDAYKPISIMECHKGFDHCSNCLHSLKLR